MLIRIAFEIHVPDDTRVETIRAAAQRAVATMEDAVEAVTAPKGAPAGTCRISMRTNEAVRTRPR